MPKAHSHRILWSNENKLLQMNYINVAIFIFLYRVYWKSLSGISDPQLWLFSPAFSWQPCDHTISCFYQLLHYWCVYSICVLKSLINGKFKRRTGSFFFANLVEER